MGLNAKQREAVMLLVEGQTKHKDIAEKLGIDVRTLRRWQDDEDFDEEYKDLKNQLQVRVRNEFLAEREGRLTRKMRRHDLLTAKIERRADAESAEGAEPPSVEQERISLAMYRELSRLEAEIAKELDQSIPGKATPVERKKKADLTCLNDQEVDVLVMLNAKVAAFNPWLESKYFGKLSDEELVKAEVHALKMWNERSHFWEPGQEPPKPPFPHYGKNRAAEIGKMKRA
jgi:hypothetical protein